MATPPDSTTTATKTSRSRVVITSFPSVPLTTKFAAPSDCGGIYRLPSIYMMDDKPSCLPDGFSTSNSEFYYSPGISCPSGYWTACHDTTGAASITTVTCCPTYGPDISLSCVPNPLALSEVWETLFCTWIAPRASGTAIRVTKSEDGRTSTIVARVTSPGGINAYGIRMVYQSTDLPDTASSTITSDSSSSTSTEDPTAPASDTSPTPSSPPTDDTNTSTGLSTGAKAAIGVVVPLVVLGALAIGFAIWWRRRKGRRGLLAPSSSAASSPPEAGHEFQGYQQGQQGQEQQLQGGKMPGEGEGYYYYGGGEDVVQPVVVHEMAGTWVPPELPSTRSAVEMPVEGRKK
ncbi:phosphoinositide 3-kinase regulatory subunit 5 [Staphylotrichum tortipilum]|uniref:Phosphoinositide 3-kinase regulatory subunit 5 n=1 Tax=Staphylotrichum tortipilum TaxID=2831512 RepID=A0AAN6MJ93_9PEZI|nr:phosphoinositide 3-kinase regulatory subunit 5 [Staphylotrichum longicolle]